MDNIDNKKPLISFIVTVKDVSVDRLKSCIESLKRLSLRPEEREIIIVDDGSKDCVVSQLDGLTDSVMYLRQPSQGTGAARNSGIRLAQGTYLQFMDGGDQLLNEGYEHCIDIIRYNDPDIVLFDTTDKNSDTATYYIPEPVDGTRYMLHNDIPSQAWGYVFNRRILLNLRFTAGCHSDDEEFTPQLFLRAERVYSTNIAAYLHDKPQKERTVDGGKRETVKKLNDMEQTLVHLRDVSNSLPMIEFQALQRRVAQLTLDYIMLVIKSTHSPRQLKERVYRLEKSGLLPLPDKDYNKKYILMRKITNSRIARKMLSLAAR